MMVYKQLVRYHSFKNFSSVRRLGTESAKEISIPVPWGKIAGKWWGPLNIKPILCLHGIQDNCGSYDKLIPVLLNNIPDISFLAIDIPGHGFSSHYPAGMLYDFNSLISIPIRIIDFFKWETVAFMGHSLGAMMAFTFNMIYPEKVDCTVCIDASKPVENLRTADNIRKLFDRLIKYELYACNHPEPPAYTMDEIIQKVTTAHKNSVKPEVANHLIERNIAPSKIHQGKYCFRRDSRLKPRITFDWPTDRLIIDASRITKPMLVCKAENSPFYEPKENVFKVLDVVKSNNPNFEFYTIPGTHHLHLNDPEVIGKYISQFLKKHKKNEIYSENIKMLVN